MSGLLNRRQLVASALGAGAAALLPDIARSDVTEAYDWNVSPPMDSRQAFIDWMVANRGEDPKYLGPRFDRFTEMIQHRDLFVDRDKRAFLMTPREEFCLKPNLPRAYDRAFLDIGFGVTISGPNLVGRMTSSLGVQLGEKVLEVGTGSGYQSAYLSNLTDKIWTIEIIKPLFERTGGVYADLIAQRLQRVQGDHPQERRRLLRLAGIRPVRQDHRHLRHRPCAAAAAAAAQAKRCHGHSRRPAGRAARAQDRQAAGGGW